MYVATEAGAVAAVNSQQSTMIWRHLLPEPNVADKLIVTADSTYFGDSLTIRVTLTGLEERNTRPSSDVYACIF